MPETFKLDELIRLLFRFELSKLQLQPAYRSQFEYYTAENGQAKLHYYTRCCYMLVPLTSRVPIILAGMTQQHVSFGNGT